MNSTKLKSLIDRYWILFILISVKFILQFVLVNPVYELHRDEFLHLDQAFHPAAGYISVPPFTSWIANIIYLLGGGLFWVRFFPALFGVATVVVAWLIVEALGGSLPAKILTSITLIFSVYTRMNVLFQPNSFDILAWTIVFYLLIKYVNSKQPKWLLLLSVITALGMYNKYNILFLIVGHIAGLLLTAQRTIFTKKAFYFAILFGILLFLPNLFWQIKNHFPVIYHMAALNKSQLVNVSRIDLLLDQLKYGLVGILTLAAFFSLVFYKPFKPYRFIGWTYVVVMTLYVLSRAKSYYTVGLYPVLFAFGSVYLDAILKKWKVSVLSLLAITHIVIFYLVAKDIMPMQSPAEIVATHDKNEGTGAFRWEDGKNHLLPQDFADMLGWQEMAGKALIAYQMIPANELENTLIYCDNYGQTGAINYYNRKKMPAAYSLNTDYIYWCPRFKKIQNILFVGNLPGKEVMDLFTEYKLVGTVENEFAREKGTKIFLLLGAKGDVAEFFSKLVEKRKSTFDIF